MVIIEEQGRKPIKMWTDGVYVEDVALNQLRNTATLPFIFSHVAVMPDVHKGTGATVGSVIPTKGAVIPAAVGVDIGCGMIAAQTPMKADDLINLKKLRHDIEDTIPLGKTGYDGRHPELALKKWRPLSFRLDAIVEKHPKVDQRKRAVDQLGTLGSGNHFIEICLDDEDTVWIMLHSGSRNIGKTIGDYFINVAKKDMEIHGIRLVDRDLAYLEEGTQYYNDYIEAVGWAQAYAAENRAVMLERVVEVVKKNARRWTENMPLNVVANCHHNYVRRETHFGESVLVTRKGAVSAREGEMGIIPGSMGARSYIVRGKGNADSFTSCSHGAGRRMSRGDAKRQLSIESLETATAGIECRKDAGVLDEHPDAYKGIDTVIAAQSELIDVVHVLRQIVNVKG